MELPSAHSILDKCGFLFLGKDYPQFVVLPDSDLLLIWWKFCETQLAAQISTSLYISQKSELM